MKLRKLFALALSLMLLAALALPVCADEEGGSGSESGGSSEGTQTTCSHSFDTTVTTSPTCTAPGSIKKICSKCGAEVTDTIAAKGHSWDSSKVTTAATCTTEGVVEYACACGEKKTEKIAKTNHTYDNVCDTDCNLCGATREVSHKASTTWSKKSSAHWHVCTLCGKEIDVGKHYPGPAATEEKDQICLTCGYVMTPKLAHTHKYATTLVGDETGHWYPCSSCDYQNDVQEHTYDGPCDADCNGCGYIRDAAHSYDGLQHDATDHWAECSVCGEAGQREPHIFDGDTCTVCGASSTEEAATDAGHSHEPAKEWSHDENTHWHECECGMIFDEALHTWDQGQENGDGILTYTCAECRAEKTGDEAQTESESGFPWPLVLGVAAVVCAGAAAVVLISLTKKKKPGKFAK